MSVLIAVAMPEEAAPFLAAAGTGPDDAERIGPAAVHRLTLADTAVTLVRTGIGSVNAAAATGAVLAIETPRVIISAGTAGGLSRVKVGDVVVGTSYRFTDVDATAFDYAPGQVPGMPERYETDPSWDAAAAGVAAPADGAVHRGEMVSGDAFVTANTVDDVRRRFPRALSADMETTALAQVAYLMGVPFVAVRGISDLCGPAGAEDFRDHVDDAGDRAAQVVLSLLTRRAG